MGVKLTYRSKSNPSYSIAFVTDIPYGTWLGFNKFTREMVIQSILMKDMNVEIDQNDGDNNGKSR